jgi:tetratricopeptide (TPR) repeat protein
MDGSVCHACGRGMSLKDLENNTFREIDGNLLCPECQLKLDQPKRMRCPHCGKQSTATLENGKYLCKHCGKELGGRADSGVIDSARPAGSRDAVVEAPPSRLSRHTRRKRDKSTRVLAVSLSLFVATTVLLGALLIRQHLLKDADQSSTTGETSAVTPTPDPPKSPDERALAAAAQWLEENPDRKADAIALFTEAIEGMDGPEYRVKARGIILELQRQMKAEAESEAKEIESLRTQLAAAQKRIEELQEAAKASPKPTEAVEPPEGPEPKPPDVAEPPPDDAPKVKETADTAKPDPAAVYDKALKASQQLVDQRRYGSARRVLDEAADALVGTEYARKARDESARVRNDAYAYYATISGRAEGLIKDQDYIGAHALYKQALTLGVPEIMRPVQEKLGELERLMRPASDTATEPPPTQATVEKLVNELKADDENVRAEAAGRLGVVKAGNAVPALIEALRDKAWFVRYRAAMSLGDLGDLSAVPALIALLDDPEAPVIFDAHRSLKKLTGQTFSDREAAKWSAWYRQNRPDGTTEPAQPAAHQPVFETRVIERRYGPDTVRISVPLGTKVPPGTRVELSRQGKTVAILTVKVSADEDVSGEISEVPAGVSISPGLTLTATLPK